VQTIETLDASMWDNDSVSLFRSCQLSVASCQSLLPTDDCHLIERDRMFRRTMLRLWAVLALGGLAACGSAPVPAGPAATAAQPTHAPVAPTVAAVEPTAATSQAPATAPTAGIAQPEGSGAAAIPEGLTSEGYHMLGRPDAPVTLVMYSDFL
jgi:hypothetical protein